MPIKISKCLLGQDIILFFILAFVTLHSVPALGDDWQATLQALEQTTPTPADSLPPSAFYATYWSAQRPNYPPVPGNPYHMAVWSLTNGEYVLDDLQFNYEQAAGFQDSDASNLPGPGRWRLDGSYGGNPTPEDDFTTNDLWLQITSFSENSANIVINPPFGDTNLSYDLYYTENLNSPINWQFVVRSPFTTYTNTVVPGLCSPQGFFRIGPPESGYLAVSSGVTVWPTAWCPWRE